MDTRSTFEQSERLPAVPLSSELRRGAVQEANTWLARFAPLLDELHELSAEQCRARLRLVPGLRSEGDRALRRLREHGCLTDTALLETLREAVRELDGQENNLRCRLALLEPGDPQGMVDLSDMRERLAEIAARREVAAVTGSFTGSSGELEFQTSPPNWAAAGFMGLFSFGWMSFTTVHAVVMIGGMSMAFGWMALAMLGFYAIFWAVGLAMAWGAILSASREHLATQGRLIVITRQFLRWTWCKKHPISPDSRAYLKQSTTRSDSGASTSLQAAFTDAEGREITLAAGRPQPELERIITRLNDYFHTVRD